MSTDDKALAVVETSTGEIAPSQAQAMAKHEIEGTIVLARRFPRNEEAALARVMKSCRRPSFASLVAYSYPRGGGMITGPSVNLAREVARCWGNIRYGCDVVQDTEDTRTIRGWAWDVETNTRASQDATFKKLIYRKGKRGEKGHWITPDERDLRELTNKQGAICERNCLLHIVPPDLIDDAMKAAKQTVNSDITADPEAALKGMVNAFDAIGVSVEDLELFLGFPCRQAQPDDIGELRKVYKSIKDGNSKWQNYVKDKPAPAQSLDQRTGAADSPAAETQTTGDTKEQPAADTETVGDDADLYFEEAVAMYRDTEFKAEHEIIRLDAEVAKDTNLTSSQKHRLINKTDAESETSKARKRLGGDM